MEARAGSGGRIPFVIERGAGRVLVDGRAVPLPPKEFRLILELAEAPGEARAAVDLVEAVWGSHSQMSGNDVYWLIWKLRQRIGDDGRRRKILANRKGHGYLIDLGTADLSVVDVLPGEAGSADSTSPADGVSGGEAFDRIGVASTPAGEAGAFDPVAPVASAEADRREPVPAGPSLPAGSARTSGPNARLRWLVAASLVLAAGVAGATARSLTSDPVAAPPQEGPIVPETPEPERLDPGAPKRHLRAEGRREKEPDRVQRPGSTGDPVVAAPPPAAAPSLESGTGEAVGAQPKPSVKRDPKPQPPALPPPPTRYLYHLYNSENGDHFVTTDAAAVTEHEAKGYVGGPVGRVYVTPEKGTKAIALNKGSAFVFADGAPETDPASTTAPLWLAKSEGDFFYTTSKSEASQDGWSATLIGYVRTL